MSFSFSFSGDDIEIDENDPSESLAASLEHASLNKSSPAHTLLPAKRHTFAELLQSLPSQISYNWVTISATSQGDESARTVSDRNGQTRVPRRALFDIRQQLMHEADPAADVQSDVYVDGTTGDGDATSNLLAGLETGDLSSGVYEGGFKTWECAVDLASFLIREMAAENVEQDQRIVELGAGSAVPSLAILQRILQQRIGGKQAAQEKRSTIKFTLCDYNEEVLRLCTAVNVFLTVALCQHHAERNNGTEAGTHTELVEEQGNDADIEIDEALIFNIQQTLEQANIEIEFISGAWGTDFVKLLRQPVSTSMSQGNMVPPGRSTKTLILASETIYSPSSLSIFSQTVLDLLDNTNSAATATKDHQGQNASTTESRTEALVAAKKVYFGVGGGVAEFEHEIGRRGGRVETVLDVQGAGVGRVILKVTGNQLEEH